METKQLTKMAERESSRQGRKFLLKSCLRLSALLIIAFPLLGITCSSEDEPEKVDRDQDGIEVEEFVADPVDYEIIETEDQSMKALGGRALSSFTLEELEALPTAIRMRYRILVSPDIRENQVEPTIHKIIDDIRSENEDIDTIGLLLYSDRELISDSYDVAMATWAPNGKLGDITPDIVKNKDRSSYKTYIIIKENLEEYLSMRGETEEKFDLSEDERKEIFTELVSAEDNAFTDAEILYPIETEGAYRHIDKLRELEDQYKAEVMEKYGITENIARDISLEGNQKRWPMPEL